MEIRTYALAAPEKIHIEDREGNTWRGCDQEWFSSHWQRLAGCGPCVVSNIMLYLYKEGLADLPLEVADKDGFIKLMEAVWEHVTPTTRGIHMSELLCRGAMGFAEAYGLKITCNSLDIGKRKSERPELKAVADFIAEGLEKNLPVAFLNLSNGAVRNLDQWHWVTIVALKREGGDESVTADIYDGGMQKTVDLKLWYETTTLGGGFVYLSPVKKS